RTPPTHPRPRCPPPHRRAAHRTHQRLHHRTTEHQRAVGHRPHGTPGHPHPPVRRTHRPRRSDRHHQPPRTPHRSRTTRPRRRLPRHRLRRRRRTDEPRQGRLHLLRDLGPSGRGNTHPDHHRRRPRSELHQRGRGGPAQPVPAQRHGAMAPERIRAHMERIPTSRQTLGTHRPPHP